MKLIFLFIYCVIIITIICIKLKNVPVEYYKSLLLISYDNKPVDQTNTKNLVKLSQNYDYFYKILGEGIPWNGWFGRFNQYKDFISSLDENEYVLICDGRDVLINKQFPYDFVAKAESLCDLDKQIIFGAERHCCCYIPEEYGRLPGMDESKNLNDIYIQFMKEQVFKNNPNYQFDYFFLNFGVFFGTVKNILWMFSNLQMSENLDDQGMAYIFYYKYPEKIYLDSGQKLIGNNGHKDCDLIWDNNKFKNIKTSTYPVFLHFPGEGAQCYNDILPKLLKN